MFPKAIILSVLLLAGLGTAIADGAAQERTLPQPGTLIGLGPQDLRVQLGEPDLLRDDPPAQVWRYDDGPCALHVFLYRANIGATPQVTYAETRPIDGAAPEASAPSEDNTADEGTGAPLMASGQPLDQCVDGFAGTGQPLQSAP